MTSHLTFDTACEMSLHYQHLIVMGIFQKPEPVRVTAEEEASIRLTIRLYPTFKTFNIQIVDRLTINGIHFDRDRTL